MKFFLLIMILGILSISCDDPKPKEEFDCGEVNCLDNQKCIHNKCLTIICVPGKKECIDDHSLKECSANGVLERTVECDTNQKCLNGICTTETEECEDNQFICNDDKKGYKKCENKIWNTINCSEEQECDEASKSCKEKIVTVCTPNEVKCITEGEIQEQHCNSDGTAWLIPVNCTGTNPQCALNIGCVEACTPNTLKCVDDRQFKRCNTQGSGYNALESCDADKHCEVDQCVFTQSCTPNQVECHTINSFKTCNINGQGYGDITSCPDSTECHEGACIGACEIAALKHSYIGCEYYALDTDNGGGEFRNNSNTPLYFSIILSNPSDSEATVTVKDGASINLTRTISPNAVEIVNLETLTPTGTSSINGESYHLWHDDHQIVGTAKGNNFSYHIKSNIPIIAYQFSPLGGSKNYSNDASMLLPIATYANEYIINSWEHWKDTAPLAQGEGSQTMTIVAKEDNTSVTINFKAKTKSGIGIGTQEAGSNTTKILSKGEVIQFATASGDLSGSKIVANKPIGVFSGHSCTNIPNDKKACDHLEEQLFPVVTWGTHYVIVKTKKRDREKDYYKIVTSEPNTRINFNPAITVNVNGNNITLTHTTVRDAGTATLFSTNQNFEMSANKPISVAQFMASANANAGTGDPASIMQVPVEQYRKSYLFLTPNTYANDFVTIISQTNENINLDGTVIPSSEFTQVGNYYFVIKTLSDGSHTISSTTPVGISVYGYDSYVSYGYPGGLNLINIKGQ